jgi:hypothetical protein
MTFFTAEIYKIMSSLFSLYLGLTGLKARVRVWAQLAKYLWETGILRTNFADKNETNFLSSTLTPNDLQISR